MGGEIFRTCPDRPWGPPSLLYNGYRVFPGDKERPGRGADPSPLLVPWSRKSRATPLLPLWAVRPVQSLSACTRVHFIYIYIYIYICVCVWGGGYCRVTASRSFDSEAVQCTLYYVPKVIHPLPAGHCRQQHNMLFTI